MSTITIPTKTIERVEKQLEKALEDVRQLKNKQTKKTSKPKFWTRKQWDESERAADEDIKAGRVYPLNRVEDLDKPLEELIK